jgi:hypothetical protein
MSCAGARQRDTLAVEQPRALLNSSYVMYEPSRHCRSPGIDGKSDASSGTPMTMHDEK